MAYNLTKSDGTLLGTVTDGSLNTTLTSLNLPGPNYVGYGLYLNENLVHIIENFSSPTEPTAPLAGQVWFDKTAQILKVFTTSQGWQPVSGIAVSPTQPTTTITGTNWFDTTNNQLKIFDGSTWNLVGPIYTKNQGVSGAIPVSVADAVLAGVTHNIIKLQYGSYVYAIFSTDSAFTPLDPIPGFTVIYPGINFNTGIANQTINANVVGSVTGSLRGDIIGNVSGSLDNGAFVRAGLLYGDLIGNVRNVTNIVATNIGSANALITTGRVNNFYSGNSVIVGGYIRGLSNVQATTATTTNLYSSNAVVTGGYINNLSNVTATAGTITNLTSTGIASTDGTVSESWNVIRYLYAANISSANATVTNGTITANIVNGNILNTQVIGAAGTFTTLQASNFSTGNVVATGGSVTGLTRISGTTAQATNFSSGNIFITGGTINALTTMNNIASATLSNSATSYGVVGNFSSGNARITGGAVDFTPIGASAASTGRFTTLGVSGVSVFSSNIVAASNTQSTSTSSGAIIVQGGMGVSGTVYANTVISQSFVGQLTGYASLASGNVISALGYTPYNGNTNPNSYLSVGVGINQKWTDVSASRFINTIVYNTTGAPIMVAVTVNVPAGGSATLQISGNLNLQYTVDRIQNTTASTMTATLQGIVPNTYYYVYQSATPFSTWVELR